MKKEIRWLGPYAPTDRHADDVTMQELVRLRVENERLREAAKDRPKDRPNEAADEIERLREALKEILTHETDYEPYDCIEIARAALKGDE